jgi:homocitrate synthase NifV
MCATESPGLEAELTVRRGEGLHSFSVSAAFALGPGRFMGLSGPSGSGKTALLRAIAGFEPGARGSIRFGGQAWLSSDSRLDPWERPVGVCFQGGALIGRMRALDQLAFAGAGRAMARALIEDFELSGLEGRKPAQLSGGQAQRLALARAVARAAALSYSGRPALLILDEALGAQDEARRARVLRSVQRWRMECGFSGLCASHRPDELMALCDAIYPVAGGRRSEALPQGAHPGGEIADLGVEPQGRGVFPVGQELNAGRAALEAPELEGPHQGAPDPAAAAPGIDHHVLEQDRPASLGGGGQELAGHHADDPRPPLLGHQDDRAPRIGQEQPQAGLLRGRIGAEVRLHGEKDSDQPDERADVPGGRGPDGAVFVHGSPTGGEPAGAILAEGGGKKILLLDSSLRDGEQRAGIALGAQDKLRLALALQAAGFGEIEAGIPAMGGSEGDLGRRLRDGGIRVPCVGWCRANIEDLQKAATAGYAFAHVAIPASDAMLEHKLRLGKAAALRLAVDCVKASLDLGMAVSLGAEDASRADRGFVADLFAAAREAGARRGRYADTVGILDPEKTAAELGWLARECAMPIEFHAHDDFGLAAANSLAAARAGAAALDATLLGIGERAGNAAGEALAAALELLVGFRTGVDLKALPGLCQLASALFKSPIPPGQPVVGSAAFLHESGIHVDGLLKSPNLYSPVDPAVYGRTHEFLPGKHSGRKAIAYLAARSGRTLDPGQAELVRAMIAERWEGGAPEDPREAFLQILAAL